MENQNYEELFSGFELSTDNTDLNLYSDYFPQSDPLLHPSLLKA